MSDQGTELGPKFFVLGTYVQSAEMMDTWKARGINTVVQAPNGLDVKQWAQAADSKGLYQIRQPSSDLHFDLNDPHLLAWAQTDEPSNTTSTLDYGAVFLDPKEIEAQAAPWRAAAAAEGKYMPVWANHVGGHIFPDWAQNNDLMKDYMAGSESDWLSSDSYPIQEHLQFVIKTNDGYTSTTQGITLDRQAAWSGGKPVMSFIGTSAYNDTNDVPTVGEFNAMAWSSVIHGASGISYFPVDLAPWKYDATPPELVQAMTTFDKEIASIDKILMNETAGGRDPATIYRSANEGTAPKVGQLPYPFEATEIKNAEGIYRIILNLSDKAATLNKPEWGLNNVSFNSYEVKTGYGPDLSIPIPSDPPTTPPVPPAPVNETIYGTAGNDTLVGKGAATLNGGLGNDTYVLGAGKDTIVDAGGTDTITSSITRSLSSYSGIERLTLTGSANIDGSGNNSDNVIVGNSGANTLSGGAGNDVLSGGLGQDKLDGGLGNDTFVLDNHTDSVVDAGGVDTITSSITRNLGYYGGIENLTLVGTANINGTGNAANNVIIGNAGNNVLDGAAGNDTLNGGAGADTLIGGTGKDILTGGAGADKFDFNSVAEMGQGPSTNDVITDFVKGQDKIDLSTIDANGSAAGNTVFAFIALEDASFNGSKGVVAWHHIDAAGTANDTTVIQGDINGDRIHDFEIHLTGLVNLTADDFIL